MIEIDMTMHPKDHMLTANKEAYLRTSRAGLKCVQNAISSTDKQPETIRNILDFGCGYGRVLRALRAGYPKATITACDLMEEATKFCADTNNLSEHNFVAPYKFMGATALSVDKASTLLTLLFKAASIIF